MSDGVGDCDEICSSITLSGKSKTDWFLTQDVALCFILSLFQRELPCDELITFPGRGNIMSIGRRPMIKKCNDD